MGHYRGSLLLVLGALVVALVLPSGCAKKTSTTKLPVESTQQGATPAQKPEESSVPAITETVPEAPVPSSDSLRETDLSARQGDAGDPAMSQALADVYFDFDQANLREDSRNVLENNARILQKKSSRKVIIEGHCDERGTSQYNLVLGEKRAQAVVRYLTDLGVDPQRMQRISYGEEQPVCQEAEESCYQKNRRAHLVFQ